MEPPLQSSRRKPESPSNTKAIKTVSALDVDMNKPQVETRKEKQFSLVFMFLYTESYETVLAEAPRQAAQSIPGMRQVYCPALGLWK